MRYLNWFNFVKYTLLSVSLVLFYFSCFYTACDFLVLFIFLCGSSWSTVNGSEDPVKERIFGIKRVNLYCSLITAIFLTSVYLYFIDYYIYSVIAFSTSAILYHFTDNEEEKATGYWFES